MEPLTCRHTDDDPFWEHEQVGTGSCLFHRRASPEPGAFVELLRKAIREEVKKALEESRVERA